MEGIFEHYLPSKFKLEWPVHSNYRLLSLEATIDFLEETQSQKISDDDWISLLDLLDPNDPHSAEASMQDIFFIVPVSSEIRCTINPFKSISGKPESLTTFVQLSKEKNGLSSERALLSWVKKYGLLFTHTQKEFCPVGTHGIIDLTDISLQNYLTLENWLYDKFKVYAVSQYNLLYRAKEMEFIQFLCYLLTENISDHNFTVTCHSQEFFPTLVPPDKPSFPASTEQIRKALEYQFGYHLQHSQVGLDADEAYRYCQKDDAKTLSGQFLPVLKIEPPNMYSALWLLVARQVMQKHKMGICADCGIAFQKERDWSKYCSDACGVRYRKKNPGNDVVPTQRS